MAKIYKFHRYSSETGQQKEMEEFEKSKIAIANELGDTEFNNLKEIFKDDSDVSIANKIDPPGERGCGLGELFPLADWLHIGLLIL